MNEIRKLIGKTAYLITDPEQRKFIITAVTFTKGDTLYDLTHNGEVIRCYDMEFTFEENKSVKLGIQQNYN